MPACCFAVRRLRSASPGVRFSEQALTRAGSVLDETSRSRWLSDLQDVADRAGRLRQWLDDHVRLLCGVSLSRVVVRVRPHVRGHPMFEWLLWGLSELSAVRSLLSVLAVLFRSAWCRGWSSIRTSGSWSACSKIFASRKILGLTLVLARRLCRSCLRGVWHAQARDAETRQELDRARRCGRDMADRIDALEHELRRRGLVLPELF